MGYVERPGIEAEPVGLKQLARLRRAVSDLTLDKLILQEASKGSGLPAAQHNF